MLFTKFVKALSQSRVASPKRFLRKACVPATKQTAHKRAVKIQKYYAPLDFLSLSIFDGKIIGIFLISSIRFACNSLKNSQVKICWEKSIPFNLSMDLCHNNFIEIRFKKLKNLLTPMI